MSNKGKVCVQLDGVTVQEEDTLLLKNIDTTLYYHEVCGIVGPNGAGKTTFLRTLLGELNHTGRIQFTTYEGEETKALRIGYVPQHLHFDQSVPLTVVELFAICLTKRPAWLRVAKGFKEKVYGALEKVEMGYALDRPIGVLSGGELQRVLLALALMPMPDLLLLDEPISGVDGKGQELFYSYLKKLKEEEAIAIVLITHAIEQLPKRCDRAFLLNQTILAQGEPKWVSEQAKGVNIWKPSIA